MDDLISRQAAIDALKEERCPCESDYDEGYLSMLDKAIWIMQEWLPSAQPELIRCKDCKHNSNTGGNYTNCNVLPQMFGRKPEDNYCSYAERRPDK